MSDYDHEAIEGAKVENTDKTTAANIAGELGMSDVTLVKNREDSRGFQVKLEVEGGFFTSQHAGGRYAIVGVTGKGNPDTITVYVVERNY